MLGHPAPEEKKEAKNPVLPTMVAKATPVPIPIEDIDIPPVHADLEAYAQLARHYTHWYWLAKHSWGELELVAQIDDHCQKLYQQLRRFEGVEGQKELMVAFTKLHHNLEILHAAGPKKTYVFCDQYVNGNDDKALKTLQDHSPAKVTAIELKDAVVCTVGESAFVQGLRDDHAFVSEAHLSPKIQSNEEKLREFIFNQIESFHADPRNVGKTIVFEGNYSKKFLELALDYCHFRKFPCDVDKDLKERIVQNTFSDDKAMATQLVHGLDRNAAREQKWENWLKEKNKYPFCKMLSEKDQHDYETRLGLTSLSESQIASDQKHCSELAKAQSITPATWCEAIPSASDLNRFNRPVIIKMPSVSFGADSKDVAVAERTAAERADNPDDPFAVIGSASKNRSSRSPSGSGI